MSSPSNIPTALAPAEQTTPHDLPLRLTSVEADKNRRRFYELRWEQDLFNGPVLVRKFGRLGTEGRSLARVYPDQESAQKEIQKLIRLRLRHGYQLAG